MGRPGHVERLAVILLLECVWQGSEAACCLFLTSWRVNDLGHGHHGHFPVGVTQRLDQLQHLT